MGGGKKRRTKNTFDPQTNVTCARAHTSHIKTSGDKLSPPCRMVINETHRLYASCEPVPLLRRADLNPKLCAQLGWHERAWWWRWRHYLLARAPCARMLRTEPPDNIAWPQCAICGVADVAVQCIWIDHFYVISGRMLCWPCNKSWVITVSVYPQSRGFGNCGALCFCLRLSLRINALCRPTFPSNEIVLCISTVSCVWLCLCVCSYFGSN